MTQLVAVAAGLAVAVSSVSADVVASCIAPQGSVCTACPTTSYHSYGGGSGGCSDGTDQPDCYSSVKACCQDWHMTGMYSNPQQCIDASNAYVPPAPNNPTAPAENSACINAVSMTEAHDNQYCMDACTAANGNYQSLSQWTSGDCLMQGYSIVNGIVDVSTSKCFTGWIYGYSEPADLSTYKQAWFVTDTPAECQLACQQEEECINWAWGSQMVDDSAQKKACNLKNETMVNGALKVDTQVSHWPDVGPTMNTDWCNYEMEESCATNHYRCLPCDGEKRCVWWSDLHVAGWKYCTPHDDCSADPSSTTPAPIPTTPKTTTPTTPAPTTPAPTTPTTPAPTTPAPTTPAPTTPAPTTPEPTTPAPTTPEPTTPAPTTPEPTTPAPTTPEPTTPEPTTPAPTTPEPTTPAPTTPAPTTPAPTTPEPTTPAPTTPEPTTPAPKTPAPTTPAPVNPDTETTAESPCPGPCNDCCNSHCENHCQDSCDGEECPCNTCQNHCKSHHKCCQKNNIEVNIRSKPKVFKMEVDY